MKKILSAILTAVMLCVCASACITAYADEINTLETTSDVKTLKFNITQWGQGSTPTDMTIQPGDESIMLPVLSDTTDYEFVGWAVSNVASVKYWKGYTYTYEAFKNLEYTDNAYTLYAYWRSRQGNYEIIVLAEPEEGGTVDGNDVYTETIPASIAAKPNDGYFFDGFYEDNKRISDGVYDKTDKEYVYKFDVEESHVFVARFTKIMPVSFSQAAAVTDGNGVGTLRFIFKAGDGDTPDTFGAYLSAVNGVDRDHKLEYTGKELKEGETFSVDVTDIESGDLLSSYYAVPYVKYGDKEFIYESEGRSAKDAMSR